VAGLDGGEVAQSLRQVVRGGRVERLYRDERREGEPDDLRITQRDVAGNDAVGFQPAHALVHGGNGEPSLPGQLGEAHPSAARQQGHDPAVDLFHHSNLT